jgi:hypothetical protein
VQYDLDIDALRTMPQAEEIYKGDFDGTKLVLQSPLFCW